MITIRKYKPDDRGSIIDICYETRDKSLNKLKNRELFALRWALCYTDYFPGYAFVAEEDGKVIGYILSTPDTLLQEKYHTQRIIPRIKKIISPDNELFNLFTSFIPVTQMAGDILNEYPAHLHINLTSQCRHKGVGTRLMEAMEENLKMAGIKGIHLGVMKDNRNAVNFYNKHNFQLLIEYDFGENSIGYFMTKKI